MKLIRLIDRGLTTLVTVLLVVSFTIMLGFAAAQVLLREMALSGRMARAMTPVDSGPYA